MPDASTDAVKQINSKDYAARFISLVYKRVYGQGIGFAKKSCKIVSLGNLAEKK